MNASELFVKALENEGVQFIFGVPGEENIDFLEAVRKSKIKFILTCHEQGAGFMADVYGRLSGKAGVCLSTIGPGATNLITPIADAFLDRSPLVAITGQADTLRMHKESHQFIDVVAMLRPIVKWNSSISSPDMVAEAVRKAFKLAEAEKPGSTHIEFPEDVAQEECHNKTLMEVRKVRRPSPDYKAVDQAFDLIKRGKKPLVLAGNGAIRKRATKQLRHFLEKTNFAVCNTFMGKGAAGYEYENNLYTIGLQSRDHVTCAFEEADLIIVVGYDLVEYSPSFWNPNGDKKIIHIDFTPAEVDYHYKPDVELVADVAGSLWELNERIDTVSTNHAARSRANSARRSLRISINTTPRTISRSNRRRSFTTSVRYWLMTILLFPMSARTRCGSLVIISYTSRTVALSRTGLPQWESPFRAGSRRNFFTRRRESSLSPATPGS